MSERTLGQTMAEYLEHLKTEGKSERTLYTYGQDAKQITSFFGAERKLSAILVPHVGKFLKSDALLKLPNGNERAEPTVRKTVRVMRIQRSSATAAVPRPTARRCAGTPACSRAWAISARARSPRPSACLPTGRS